VDLALTDDQQALRELARRILTDLVTQDRLKQVEAGGEAFDRGVWEELARAGLLGVGIPEEHGGLGGGMADVCLLLEEQGRTVAPVPLYPTIVLGAMPIAEFGSTDQQGTVPRATRGEIVLTAALPPDGGAPSVTANGGLHGTVEAVRAASSASVILVPAREEQTIPTFLVDPEEAVLETQIVTTREPRARLTLDGLSGEPLGSDGAPGAFEWLAARAVVGLCALQVGVCERALRLTAEYVGSREQFDRPLGTFQAVQQRLADAYIDVESMRWTMWQAAWRLDEGLPAEQEVAVAKYWAAEAGQRVVATAQHLHGGIGVDVEYPLHRYTLWAKDLELSLGGAGRHLARLGDLVVETS
jgi:alkylation response protein AidB-like acyl-CoA dehydrogenase